MGENFEGQTSYFTKWAIQYTCMMLSRLQLHLVYLVILHATQIKILEYDMHLVFSSKHVTKIVLGSWRYIYIYIECASLVVRKHGSQPYRAKVM
jgi:hypothetical protein